MIKINLNGVWSSNEDFIKKWYFHLQDDGGEHNTTTGFGATQQEINVVLDLLDNNIWLFEVKKRSFLTIELCCSIFELQIAYEIQSKNYLIRAEKELLNSYLLMTILLEVNYLDFGVFTQVKDDELEHERKMQEAMEKIQRANEFRQVNCIILDCQDLILKKVWLFWT